MIANVAVIVIMTLLSSPHVHPKTNHAARPKKLPLFLTSTNREWQMRPYNPSRDQSRLEEMCRNNFGGNDYLPKMALTFEKDPNCHFQTLARVNDNACAAVANMRMLNQNMAWLEAVRTCENYRNQGLAHRLLQCMIVDAVDMGYKQVLSCTIASNTAMRRVFDKLQMKELTHIQMIKFDALRALPGWAANDDAPCQHLLDSLDIQHLVSASARESQWSVVKSTSELERILQEIQSKGGCGLMPGIYEVIGGQRAQESIEQQLVFSLQDHVNPAVMVFQRDERISSLKSNWSLSLAGTHDEHLQAALWHACSPEIQCKLTHKTDEDVAGFTVAFEGVIPTDGPLCSTLPLTDDMCHVYGTTLNDVTIV